MAFTGSFGGDYARDSGARANAESKSNGKSGDGKSSSSKSNASKSTSTASSPNSTMSEAAQRNAYGAGRAAAQAIASGTAKSSGSGNLTSGNSKLTDRVASINKTLNSYGVKTASVNSNLASAPSYARPGYGDTLATQRNITAASAPGYNASGFSPMGGASSYGMTEDGFNETINTDNLNGVLGNLQRKARMGTLTAQDQENINDASAAYQNRTARNVVSSLASPVAGYIGDGIISATKKDSYFTGVGDRLASGDYDSSRLAGQEGRSLGNEGLLDSALKIGSSLVGAAIPGMSVVAGPLTASLTTPASGTGQLLYGMAESPIQQPINQLTGTGGGNNSGFTPPSRLTPSTSDLTSATPDLSFNYDPTRYGVTSGTRGA
ncbi:hypothetical protein SAMN05880558_11334 [Aeromonas sp. RU39B]|uniref:hypothetical protein n=1 Tax=Aeromonas sp. RU39B TaxID=1907416 RepID=UPI0009546C8C|nr:hypothetical protein [Aeromonas sp. RU39B]SIR40252.1 hypothetical protein SAMN05880558_11334 [Aeromonas sp. RU39B]